MGNDEARAALPEPLVVLSLPLDLVLFVVGCGAFLWAYAVAVGRSRYEALTWSRWFLRLGTWRGHQPPPSPRAAHDGVPVPAGG